MSLKISRTAKIFKIFPSYDIIESNTEVGVKAIVKGEGETRFLLFDKPVVLLELTKLESLKIAAALLGRIGICENCGTPFRRKGRTGLHAKARFCCRECFFEWCKKTGGPVFGRRRIVETPTGFEVALKEYKRKTAHSIEERREWGRKGGLRTQQLHEFTRRNLLRGRERQESVVAANPNKQDQKKPTYSHKPRGVPIAEVPCGSCPKLKQRGDHYSCPRNRLLPNFLPKGFGSKCPEREKMLKQTVPSFSS